jgi:hypothetical protein
MHLSYKYIHRIFFVLGIILCNSSFGVELVLEKPNSTDQCIIGVRLKGPIAKNDSSKFSNFIEQLNKSIKVCNFWDGMILKVGLDSEGGDVDEAMRIGRLIKNNSFGTITGQAYKCLSSCVLILASGVERQSLLGNVGIHRPYFSDLNEKLTIDEIRKIKDKKNKEIKTYLEEMDSNPALLDAMISIEPSNIKMLTEDELKFYRLIGDDANYEEKKIAMLASVYNMTSSEYRRQSDSADKICRKPIGNSLPSASQMDKEQNCWFAYMWKTTIEDIIIKKEIFRTTCKQENNWNGTGNKRICYKNTMTKSIH